MSIFECRSTFIAGVVILERQVSADSRGQFSKLFCSRELNEQIGNANIEQINHSFTLAKGTVRGMHYQLPPYSEFKIIACLRGKVFDVALDLRPESPTFARTVSIELDADDNASLIIPEGVAHGFQALEDNCELLYAHTQTHKPEVDSGINALDPDIAIRWPLPVTNLSERDKQLPYLNEIYRKTTK